MRTPRILILSMLLAAAVLPALLSAEVPGIDIAVLARMPMLDNGRVKPFDTYARETVRFVTDRESFQGRDPVAFLLDVAFDFKKWTEAPIIEIGFLPLKEKLGIKKEAKFVSPSEIVNNKAYNDLLEAVRNSGKDTDKLPRLEKEAVILYHKISILESQMDGQGWKLVPHESDANAAWRTIGECSDENIKSSVASMSAAFKKGDAPAFNKALADLAKRLQSVSKVPYPQTTTVDREVWYHRFRPFEKAAIFYGLSFLAFLICSLTPPRRMYKLAVALALGGFALHTYGLVLRSLISGRAPVSNVYETMLFVPFGINMFALIFELVHRARYFGLTASLLGAGILTLSDFVSLDPYVSPLVPVLRSNYWLIIHVLTITLGYAAATLAMGMAHMWLGMFLFNGGSAPSLKNVEKYLYNAIQVTVLFIGAGTILGGVWANQSWGRYWGWDPKETWALISLLAFLAIVHARVVNGIGGFGTAVSAILAWQCVLFCWYGVNYFLVGLHSYAGGDTAVYVPWQIWAWAGFEAVFLAVSWMAYKRFVARSKE